MTAGAHGMTSHGGVVCLCGEWLYEDNRGAVFCPTGGRIERYKSRSGASGGRND